MYTNDLLLEYKKGFSQNSKLTSVQSVVSQNTTKIENNEITYEI